jgi:peptidoglycan/xylan/chitin deacetylase (PgdA/CDA1 family)
MVGMIPVLTYHSQVISQNQYGHNDHISLANDLRLIHQLGLQIIPLHWAVQWLRGEGELPAERCVCISFDDGAVLDWQDVDYPGLGPQRGFAGILRDFQTEVGAAAQPHLHATSFVIACPAARAAMDQKSLFGQSWMADEWWPEAQRSGLMAIENHSWDHFHPDASAANTGNFSDVRSESQCRQQLLRSSEFIHQKSGRRPQLFAYPCGQWSEYLRQQFLPEFQHQHGLLAAFTTEAGYLHRGSDIWQLPRFVSMQHWHTGEQLAELLRAIDLKPS